MGKHQKNTDLSRRRFMQFMEGVSLDSMESPLTMTSKHNVL